MCVQFLHCIMVSLYSMCECVWEQTQIGHLHWEGYAVYMYITQPCLCRRVCTLSITQSVLQITCWVSHMLGTDQGYISYSFSMFHLWHTKAVQCFICVEMSSDFVVWKRAGVAFILVCWSRLLIPLAAQAWKGGTGLFYDWFLDVSITLLKWVMRVTGGLFMELFRVMVKASLNTQAKKGSAHVTPGKLAHPWLTR